MMIPKKIKDWVTFSPNKLHPIHNWFYYKEGFSKELVQWSIGQWKLQEPILDPFCGSGTTLLTCKELGLESIGLEVSPLAAFVSRVKTCNYALDDLQKEFEKLQSLSPQPIEIIPIDSKIRRLFYHAPLEKIWCYKTAIEKINDEKIRNLFLLALIDVTPRAANIQKSGGSLRKHKKQNVDVQKMLFEKINLMLKDLQQTNLNKIEPEIFQTDARAFKLKPESIGSVFTSPPYLNKEEYTTIFKLEMGIFFGAKQPKLEKFLGDSNQTTSKEFLELPANAQTYFADLKKVLQNIYLALKPGAKAVFNISGGCYQSGPVQSDKCLEKIAKQTGFLVQQNIACRWVQCHSSQRSEKTGKAKEALVVLQKMK